MTDRERGEIEAIVRDIRARERQHQAEFAAEVNEELEGFRNKLRLVLDDEEG